MADRRRFLRNGGAVCFLVLAVVAGGCGGTGDSSPEPSFVPPSSLPSEAPSTLLQGRSHIQQFAEDTRQAVFADFPIREYHSSPASLLCGVGGEDLHQHDVAIRTEMPDDVEPAKLTQRVADYWDSLGLPTWAGRDTEKSWEAETRFYDNFSADLIVTTRGGGQVTVRARTPCMSGPGVRSADLDSSWPSLPPPE